jgi:hypothetical protein
MKQLRTSAILAMAAALAAHGTAQVSTQGPSSSRTPYLVASHKFPGIVRQITSLVTTMDLVPLTGSPATPYEMVGIMDGLGAYDNGDGTVTVLCNHELGSSSGSVRRHGARGTFISEIVLDKQTLQVVSAQDLVETYIDLTGTPRNAANNNGLALARFCSGDLADATAYYNAVSGLGTQDRIYLCGEEGGVNGYAVAAVATGSERGLGYLLGAFNLAQNGSGINAVGGWENLVANPFAQDLTIVAGTNDGGSGVMNNTVNVYVGQKQATGNAVERAGLTNGINYFVSVVGNPVEIVASATQATNITNGTRFTLESFLSPSPSGTTFSRPEDGHWDPTNPRDFYFVTTNRLDTATSTGDNPTIGASGTANQVGKSRLWRLRFDDITNPLAGGVIDLLIDGEKNGTKVNMLDNMCVGGDGMVYLTEDPGNTTYNAKTWAYDVQKDLLVQLVKMDPQRWGELAAAGGTPGAVLPHNNNEEISGVIDVTHLFPHAADERVLLLDVQDHSTNAGVANANTVEGGQLLLAKVALRGQAIAFGTGCGLTLAGAPNALPVVGSTLAVEVGNIPTGAPAFVMVGLSDRTWLGQPLPQLLDSFGATGCTLYQDIAVDGFGSTVATGSGVAQWSKSIPNDKVFVGFEMFLQAWAPSASANPAGLVASGAIKVVVGL